MCDAKVSWWFHGGIFVALFVAGIGVSIAGRGGFAPGLAAYVYWLAAIPFALLSTALFPFFRRSLLSVLSGYGIALFVTILALSVYAALM